jgi:hypothetical protein
MFVSSEPPSEAGMSRAEAMAALSEVIDLQAPAWQRWLGDVGLLEEAAKLIKTLPPRPSPEDVTGGRAGGSGGGGGVGGGFGTPQGGSFSVSPGGSSDDGSPDNNIGAVEVSARLTTLSSAEAEAAHALADRHSVDIDSPPEAGTMSGKSSLRTPSPSGPRGGGLQAPNGSASAAKAPPSTIRLHHRAVVVASGSADGSAGLGSLVRQLSIDQFDNESKRIGNLGDLGTPAAMGGGPDRNMGTPNAGRRTHSIDFAPESVHRKVLNQVKP